MRFPLGFGFSPFQLPPPPGQRPPGETQVTAPGQQDFDLELGPSSGVSTATLAQPLGANAGPDRVEFATKPHLRFIAGLMAILFLVIVKGKGQQVAALPVMLFVTTATSALWCTPRELVLALGPVPTCIFQRRIRYEDIAAIVPVRGCLRTFAKLMWRGTRFYQPHGVLYALTLGKDFVEIQLKTESDGKAKSVWWPHRILVSVDCPEDIVAYVNFRKQNGAEAPLPAELAPSPLQPTQVSQMVLCDACGATQWIMCDFCDLLLLPFQSRAGPAAGGALPLPTVAGKSS